MRRKILFSLLLALAALALGALFISLPAMVDAQGPEPQAALGTAFTYQGRLADGGSPANGTYDFQFRLYNAASGGTQVGSTVTKGDVTVTDGLFTASLDFGSSAFTGAACWLQVGVRPGSSTGAYTTLAPRQPLTAAPYALYSLNADRVDGQHASAFAPASHDHWGEDWSGSGCGLYLGSNDNHGLWARGYPAIYAESGAFPVSPPSGNMAIYGYAADTGVYGWGANFGVGGASADGVGVKGLSTHNDGVVGETSAAGKSGLYGHSTDGFGVTGRSTNSYGVQGFGIRGVHGEGSIGVYGAGTTWGVYGTGEPYGAGVRGEGTSGAGVVGESDSGGAVGAFSNSGTGLVAGSNSGDIIEGYGSNSADTEFKVDNDGDVYADRAFHDWGADFADMVAVAGDVAQYEPGDVLAIGPEGLLVLAQAPYATNVAGVYSTQPGFVGGDGDDESTEGKIPLALVGVVPVKASAENGPIHPGALLVTSSTPGHAMGADNPPPGTILGKALEPLEAGTGVILVLVTLQ